MVKKELTKEIAALTGVKASEVENMLKAMDEIIVAKVSNGEDVKIGLGTFKRKETKGREGVSKIGGVEKAWKTEDSHKPSFTPNKQFKESVK